MYFVALTAEPLILLLVEIAIKIFLSFLSRPFSFFFFWVLFTLLFSCSLGCYLFHFDIDLMKRFLYLLFTLLILTLMEILDGIIFLCFVHSGCCKFFTPLIFLHSHPLLNEIFCLRTDFKLQSIA